MKEKAMKYEYVLRKELFVTVEVDAEDEDAADEKFAEMSDELPYLFRDEVLESETEVFEVYENREDGRYRIYSVE